MIVACFLLLNLRWHNQPASQQRMVAMNVARRNTSVERMPPRPAGARWAASDLLCKLLAKVNRERLATDHIYFGLVSEIAELLPDEEVAILTLYFAPPLAVGARFRARRAAARSTWRNTESGRHA